MKKGAEYCPIWEVSECTYDYSGLEPLLIPVCSSLYAQEPIEVDRVSVAAQPAQNSPGAEVDSVQEAIEVQAQEAIEVQPQELIKTPAGVEVNSVEEPIAQATETSPGVEVDPVSSSPIESKFGRIVYPRLTQKSIEIQAQESIAQAAKKSPGAKTEPKCDRTSDQNFPGVEVDRFPILTGIAFSDRFLARYSPPEISDKADADGQLSLLVFEVSELEPPDPDDFESLDGFQQAIARWDCEYPEELATSLDSMCEWAPCPADWYQPDTEIEPSLVLDVLLAIELPKLLELPRDLELPKLS